WSDGAAPMLLVCEEAHRYASADRNAGFGPTRRAISRLAKEGRKYGIYLGLVTQRPAELDPTIISQCSTLFAMRMSNDRDQALLRSAVSDTAANLFSFVPSLGTREALAFGVGVPLPTRLTFTELPAQLLPRSDTFSGASDAQAIGQDLSFIGSVVERWRGATMSQRAAAETTRDSRLAPPAPAPAPATASSLPPLPPMPAAAMPAAPMPAAPPPLAPASDPNRLSLLKKPLIDRPDHYGALRSPPPMPPNRLSGR